jgi:MFS family permease
LPFSLSRLEAALGAPFVGYLIDRFDVRVMLVAGTLLAGLGLVLLSLTHSYLLFVLVFIGPLSFGFQAGFNQATLAVVAHWFRRKRGLAMAIVQTGQAIGGVLIFPLVALAVLKLGWRAAAVLSGLAVFMLLPLVLLIRRSPESMGLLPDGESSARSGASGLAAPLVDAREYTTREALKTPTFWLLAAFHGLRNVPYAGVTVHLVPLLVWKGLDEAGAAFYVGHRLGHRRHPSADGLARRPAVEAAGRSHRRRAGRGRSGRAGVRRRRMVGAIALRRPVLVR